MTILEGDGAIIDAVVVPDLPPGMIACGFPDCGVAMDTAAKIGAHRWNAHGIRGEKSKGKAKSSSGGGSGDGLPPSVTLNLGGPAKATGKGGAKEAELAAVEARAVQLMKTVAALLLMAKYTDDAMDVERGAVPIGQAVRELAVYEEWLRKLAAGGEMGGRMMAWVNLLLVVLAMAVPILVRHEVLPDNLAEIAASMFGAAATLSAEGDAGAQAA